jgi:hypothetical protein
VFTDEVIDIDVEFQTT